MEVKKIKKGVRETGRGRRREGEVEVGWREGVGE